MAGALARLDDAARRALDGLGRRPLLAVLAVVAVAAAMLLPGQAALPLTDRDEARYVQASKQMLETGDFIDPRNLDAPRWKKPVGIYWLQAAAASATGEGAAAPLWAYRLPSALGMLAAALLTLWAARPVAGGAGAAAAGLAVASAVIPVLEGHIAKTDAALLATVVAAQGALIRLQLAPRAGFTALHALFWAALAAGVLIKGPVIVMVCGATLAWLIVAERGAAPLVRMAPGRGLLLFALLALPWFVAIGIVTQGGFYAEALGRDFLGKLGGAAEGHTGPPGYYLMTIWVSFWPWAALALLAAPWAWAQRRDPAVRLLAAWVVPTWAIFAVATTKLPHYTMPLMPALAALAGLWLAGPARLRPAPAALRWTAAALFVPGGLAVAALTAGAPAWFEGRVLVAAALAAGAAAALIAAGAAALARGRLHAFAALALAAALVLMPALTRVTLPGLDSLFLSPRMAALDARFDACAPFPAVVHGYAEMSLAFYAGSDTRFVGAEGAWQALSDPRPGARAFLPAEMGEALAARNGGAIHVLGRVEGINYNEGPETRDFWLFARRSDHALAPCRVAE